jgi:hypothetical protein
MDAPSRALVPISQVVITTRIVKNETTGLGTAYVITIAMDSAISEYLKKEAPVTRGRSIERIQESWPELEIRYR